MSIADFRMEAADLPLTGSVPAPKSNQAGAGKPRLHCISSVREQQGMSLRSVARRLAMDAS